MNCLCGIIEAWFNGFASCQVLLVKQLLPVSAVVMHDDIPDVALASDHLNGCFIVYLKLVVLSHLLL